LGYTTFRALKADATDRQCLMATRAAMVLFTGLGLLFGLAMGNLYNLIVFAGAIAFPSIAPTFICGILWKRANVKGALASIITGTLSWVVLVWLLVPYTDGEVWDAIYIGAVPAFLLGFLAIVVVSLATQGSCPPNPARDVDGNDISDTRLFSW
jgi:Na+/proline symporter